MVTLPVGRRDFREVALINQEALHLVLSRFLPFQWLSVVPWQLGPFIPCMTLYLSSALSDLKAERDAVKEALGGRYRIVESYEADPGPLWQSCITDVQGCAAYVGIIGLRYGFVPPEQTKSITELEFDAASAAGLNCYTLGGHN